MRLQLFLLLLPLAIALPHPLFSSAARQLDPAVPRVPPEFNINAGAPAVGRFVAEDPQWLVNYDQTSVFVVPDAVIGGAEPRNLPMYMSHRFGVNGASWGYDIPVMEPGVYGCTVHFAETDSSNFFAGARVFDLYIATTHGPPVRFPNVDIIAELNGAEFTVLTKTAPALVIPGVLSIRVVPITGNAIISGITCERTDDLPDGVQPDFDTDPNLPVDVVTDTVPPVGPMVTEDQGTVITGTEININVGGPAIGRFIAEDFRWIRGTTSQWDGPPGAIIGGAEEKNAPAIVSQRYGVDGSAWGLVIPVQMSGLYDCSLHWAEVDSASFFIGARIFNIIIQDRVDNDIDIFELAGEAPFTAVVRTYVDLQVGHNLSMAFDPIVGNAFLSAITCERTADLPPGAIEDLIPDDPITLPMPSDGLIDPTDIPVFTLDPSPLPMDPTPDTFPTVTVMPTVEPSLSPEPTITPEPLLTAEPLLTVDPTPAIDPALSAEPSISPELMMSLAATPTPEITSESTPIAETPAPSPTLVPIETPMTIADVPVAGLDLDDALPSPQDDEILQDHELRGLVTDGTNFNNTMKEALKIVLSEWSNGTVQWAVIKVDEQVSTPTVRQGMSNPTARQDSPRIFNIDMQSLYETNEAVALPTAFSNFINTRAADKALEEEGVGNLKVELRSPATLATDGQGGSPSESSTGVIAGSIVGSLLGLLIIVALSAFFVVRRNRQHPEQTGAFDGPPPAMTESEMSSGLEHSETAHSAEYLDDDSTFTAATSRGGDHVDQVGFDKDVFGRGTTAGAHGAS